MIRLITGAVGCGKSTRLRSLHQELHGDGLVNERFYVGGELAGQRIVRLSTGESVIFACRDGFRPAGWKEISRLGPYSFSRRGLGFAERVILDALGREDGPLFIDEIGPLELRGEGLHLALIRILAAGRDLIAVAREGCLEDALRRYHLEGCEILRV